MFSIAISSLPLESWFLHSPSVCHCQWGHIHHPVAYLTPETYLTKKVQGGGILSFPFNSMLAACPLKPEPNWKFTNTNASWTSASVVVASEEARLQVWPPHTRVGGCLACDACTWERGGKRGGSRSMACFLCFSPSCFIRQGLSQDRELTIRLDCPAGRPEHPCPCIPSAGFKRCALPHLNLMWMLGAWTPTFWLYNNHLTSWAVSPAPLVTLSSSPPLRSLPLCVLGVWLYQQELLLLPHPPSANILNKLIVHTEHWLSIRLASQRLGLYASNDRALPPGSARCLEPLTVLLHDTHVLSF